MATRETLETFAKKLPSFPLIVQKRIVKDWQNYTEEAFAKSQEWVPILTGDLQRSGGIANAKITAGGIESSITYTMPYANVIHELERNGKSISLKEKGFQYKVKGGTITKARRGHPKYLSRAVRLKQKDVIEDMFKSISMAWDLI